MESRAQEAFLLLGLALCVSHRPVAQHFFIFAQDAIAAAWGIQQDAVEIIVEIARQHIAWRLAQNGIGQAAAFQIADQGGYARVAWFVGQEQAGIAHARPDLSGLAAGCGCQIENALVGLGVQDFDR